MGKTGDYFKDWQPTEIIYDKKVSKDGVGNVIYASDTVNCYIQETLVEVVNDKGETIVSSSQLYFVNIDAVITSINFGDRFFIDNIWRPVKSIGKFRDEDGVLDLVVVYL
jgi:hypothetical protein